MTNFWLDIIKVKENIKNLTLGDLPLHQKCIKHKLLNWGRLYNNMVGIKFAYWQQIPQVTSANVTAQLMQTKHLPK